MEDNPFSKPINCLSGCQFVLKVGEESFNLCKEVMIKLSDYFLKLLNSDFMEKEKNEVDIKDESAQDILLFLECTVPHPNLVPVNGKNLETLMRLADKFQTPTLKHYCSLYTAVAASHKSPEKCIEFLKLMYQYNFDNNSAMSCLPVVACLNLNQLEQNKSSIGAQWYSMLVTVKLKAIYARIGYGDRSVRFSDSHIDRKLYYQCNTCKNKIDIEQNTSDCYCNETREMYKKLLQNMNI